MTRDRDLERRVLDTRARAMEHVTEPVDDEFAAMICDRCGLTVRITSDPRRAPMHESMNQWGHGPEGDLCPTCAG